MSAENPFSAHRFSLGAFGWIDGAPGEITTWANGVADRRLAYQIMGGHGTGKSTLLAHLGRALEARGRTVVRFRCGEGALSAARAVVRARTIPDVILADEAQCWVGFRLVALRRTCAALGTSLVVATHADLGLSTLSVRRVSPELAHEIVSALVRGKDRAVPSHCDLAMRLRAHGGNLREVLFELYDEVEDAHRSGIRRTVQ